MQSEIIKLANLAGEWHHSNSRKRLIIICHGYQDSNENPTIIAIAEGLNKKGYDTFTLNFSKSTGGFDIEHQVQDVRHALNHFRNYDELVLLAASFAALTAAIAAIKLPQVKRLITLNGFFGQRYLGQPHRNTYRKFRVAALIIPRYRKILKYFKRELQPQLIKAPVLVIHSKVDRYVYTKQSRNFYRLLTCPKRFIELESAKHGITSPEDRQRVISEIRRWLKDAEPPRSAQKES